VKLADLGASTQLTDTMTKANTLIGSPNWMAPEIMMQEKYDAKAGQGTTHTHTQARN